MIWNAILKIVCISLWTLVGVICAIVTQYELDELYTDKICSGFLIEFELFASSLLSCLAYKISSGSLIFHRKSKTCYGIKQDYKIDDFTTTLVGAKLYVKATDPPSCPRGIFLHESCYIIYNAEKTWSDNMGVCKIISTTGHLAHINTDEENVKVVHWLSTQLGFRAPKLLFWLGAKYDNGWKWSDGTQVDLQYWPQGRQLGLGGLCLVLIVDREASESKWDAMVCETSARMIGLCELDPL